jgi:hypothetical protein
MTSRISHASVAAWRAAELMSRGARVMHWVVGRLKKRVGVGLHSVLVLVVVVVFFDKDRGRELGGRGG